MARIVASVMVAAIAMLGAAAAQAATISGTVTGPDGKPVKGAFVEAEELRTRTIVHVLSDKDGKYRIENLPQRTYQVRVNAIGYEAPPKDTVTLDGAQTATLDFTLKARPIRWQDLSRHQGKMLLPDGPGKQTLTGACFGCHGFQNLIAAQQVRTEAAWRTRVRGMMRDFHYFLEARVTPQQEQDVVAYLTKHFGPAGPTPARPTDVPTYASHTRAEFADEAMKLSYVSYPLKGRGRFPASAKPEADGNLWIWTYAKARFSKLDPRSGEVTEYNIPTADLPNGIAGVHSVVMAPDGGVWFSIHAKNGVGRLDPATGRITKYFNDKNTDTTGRHTLLVSSKGVVFATGAPLQSFDPATGVWTNYPDAPQVYGMAFDTDENIWFSQTGRDPHLGKLDVKSGTVKKYKATGFPRRLKVDQNTGLVWYAEYNSGKIIAFDPKTERFKEYVLPGPAATPYAMTLDKRGHVWYSSMDMDLIAELDPATGKVIQYPFPYAENGMRDFWTDEEGRIWFGTQVQDRVGYFTPPGSNIPRPEID